MGQQYQQTVSHRIARWGYSLLWLLPLAGSVMRVLVSSLIRWRAPSQRQRQRVGCYPQIVSSGGVLFHCVSVGEVVAASKLIQRLRMHQPELPVTVTTTTATGAAQLRQLFDKDVQHLYLPYDSPMLMARLLNKVKPEKVLITEVELWPNLIHQCWRQNISIYVINARMTGSSCRRYAKLPALVVPMLEKITAICAQGQRDYNNYLRLGAPPESLWLTQNLKFDLQATLSDQHIEQLRTRYNPLNKLVILAGSTHEGEESALLDAFEKIKIIQQDVILLLVPRHPQRFERVWQCCQQRTLNICRSSHAVTKNADIILVDEMGVLASLYSVADIAFVGGSLTDKGGHNALEAAVWGTPAIMGPHTYNNPEICQVLAEGEALKIVNNEAELTAALVAWCGNSQQRQHCGAMGKKIIAQNSGAIAKTMKVIFPLSEQESA